MRRERIRQIQNVTSTEPTHEQEPGTIEKQVASLQVPETDMNAPLDISELAPKKIDWDLKRDTQDQLDKLQRKTERAISKLLRERIGTKKPVVGIIDVSSDEEQDSE